jgi:prophage antirepressor-like protein
MTTEIITLNYNGHPLEGVRLDGQIWLRVTQIVPPLGFAREQGIHNIYSRHSDEFGSDETRLITEETEGGPQTVRVFSLRGARLLCFFARTEPAARFRKWVLDVLEGRAPVSRAHQSALEKLPAARAILDEPLVREAIERLDAIDADMAAHQRAQHEANQEVRRLAALSGLRLDDLRQLRKLERILARLPSLGAQPALPLDA